MNVQQSIYDALERRLRSEAELKAANRRLAGYGPAGGDPNAKTEGHYEWQAADAIRDLRLQSKRITLCQDCGASWYDDDNNGVACPYCQITALRAERDALRKALVRAKGDFIYVKAYVTLDTYLEKQLQSAIDDCKAALAAQEKEP